MSATDGSPTKIGWKRRSSAASFSMCLRYSSSVVAPIARSSPRASIGFSMFAASTAPSAAPAPTIVCSSSMKRMISPAGVLDLLEHGLQPLLELAAVLRAGEQRADVERPHALALQPLGHVAGDDALREPLDDRRLADARVADQHRVVLRAAREHLDDAADLLVAADDRVELALLGELGQVAAELLERLVGALGILRRDALARRAPPASASSSASRGTTSSASSRCSVETYSSSSRRISSLGAVEHLARTRSRRRGCWFAALHRAASAASARLGLRRAARRRRPGALDERPRQLLVEQREQQVLGVDLGVAGRRASSCAAATASWDFRVSLLKSIVFSGRRVRLSSL